MKTIRYWASFLLVALFAPIVISMPVTTNFLTKSSITTDQSPTGQPEASYPVIAWRSCINSVEGLLARAKDIAIANPDLVTLETIGESWLKTRNPNEGYPIQVLRLGKKRPESVMSATAGTCPNEDDAIMVLLAGLHAREITVSQVAIEFAEQLLKKYRDNDGDARMILDHQQIDILFLANPDGRHIVDQSEEGTQERNYRKNANYEAVCDNPNRFNTNGVDLNRNFAFGWRSATSYPIFGSSEVCNQFYSGVSAASESEVSAIQSYLKKRLSTDSYSYSRVTSNLFIDLHSFGNCVRYPYSHTTMEAPAENFLFRLAAKVASQNDVYYIAPSSNGINFFNANAGTSIDYVYGEVQRPALTIETGSSFFPSCKDFEDTDLPNAIDALNYVAKISSKPYTFSNGPEVTSLSVSGNRLSGRVGDSLEPAVKCKQRREGECLNGFLRRVGIGVIRYSVDEPVWNSGANVVEVYRDPVPYRATAEQHNFDIVLDSDAFEAGTEHTVYVQAVSDRNHGPVSAVIWTVGEAVEEAF